VPGKGEGSAPSGDLEGLTQWDSGHLCVGPITTTSDLDAARIVIGDEPTLRAWGRTRNLILRHEIGHCNGWGHDHAGAR
jgi:hypothetical protein